MLTKDQQDMYVEMFNTYTGGSCRRVALRVQEQASVALTGGAMNSVKLNVPTSVMIISLQIRANSNTSSTTIFSVSDSKKDTTHLYSQSLENSNQRMVMGDTVNIFVPGGNAGYIINYVYLMPFN